MSSPTPQVDTFDVTPGVPFDRQLGYLAHSVVVDNRTNQFMYLQGRWVDPGIGVTMQIAGTQKAQVEWGAPPGRVAAPVNPAERAQVTYSEDPNPPGGTGVAIAGSGTTLIKTAVSPPGVTLFELGPVTPPTGTRAIGIAPRSAAAAPKLRFVSGVTTGATYAPFGSPPGSTTVIAFTAAALFIAFVDLAVDASFSVLVDNGGFGATTWDIYALTDAGVITTIRQSPGEVLEVDIASAAAFAAAGFPVQLQSSVLADPIPVSAIAGANSINPQGAVDRLTVFPNISRAIGTYTTVGTGAPVMSKGVLVMSGASGGGAGTGTVSVGAFDGTNTNYFLTGAAFASGVNNIIRAYPGITAAANVSISDVLGHWPAFRLVIAGAALTVFSVVDYLA